jgi:hypothetical protein
MMTPVPAGGFLIGFPRQKIAPIPSGIDLLQTVLKRGLPGVTSDIHRQPGL